MMHNIDLVTEHILNKNRQKGINNRRTRLHFHHTADRKNYWFAGGEEAGDFWRLTNCVEDSIGPENTHDPKVLAMVGKAFGQFQRQLCDFDASQLTETIPNFHNTPLRLSQLLRHAQEDPCVRRQEVEEELSFFRLQQENCGHLVRQWQQGNLPLRVTHNDTKSNNVLLDRETLEPLVVIDLDTVMPGLAAFDFGDGVRFAASTAPENEEDLSKVALDLSLYQAFAQGYIGETANFLTTEEISSMAEGAITITVELAARFLDDYLTGDHYFTTHFPKENLVRARCQIALAQDMMRHYDEMVQIVETVAESHRNKTRGED
jgi:Ser/Thr protein kinase RdoA (MazF antagonist)